MIKTVRVTKANIADAPRRERCILLPDRQRHKATGVVWGGSS